MDKLFQEERQAINDFEEKIKTETFTQEDLISFKDKFKALTDESQVMCQISDRLQKKLDAANNKIKEKNEEINLKNEKLNDAIQKMLKAQLGKKASTIMLTVTIIFFVTEEIYLEPVVEYLFGYASLVLVLKGLIAISLKGFESGLEAILEKITKQRILKQTISKQEEPQKPNNSMTEMSPVFS